MAGIESSDEKVVQYKYGPTALTQPGRVCVCVCVCVFVCVCVRV